jgi:hypothetical protein
VNRRFALDGVTVAAGVEVVTGLVLVIRPSLFAWLLFGAEFAPPGLGLGRLAGFSLLALALACWPGLGAERRPATRALLLFSLLSAIFLIYLGVRGELVGILLWPAAATHAALTIRLTRDWFGSSKRTEAGT